MMTVLDQQIFIYHKNRSDNKIIFSEIIATQISQDTENREHFT